jgi:hypothetical protein
MAQPKLKEWGGRRVPSLPAGEAERRRWFDFLAAESGRHDGLLCFYDREKSPRVLSSCQVLAQRLQARMWSPAPPAPGPDREEEPCPFPFPAEPWGPG